MLNLMRSPLPHPPYFNLTVACDGEDVKTIYYPTAVIAAFLRLDDCLNALDASSGTLDLPQYSSSARGMATEFCDGEPSMVRITNIRANSRRKQDKSAGR